MQISPLKDLQTIASLAKRRGFVFQSSEIYGGLNSCWDYGPLGAQMKFNINMSWWNDMTRRPDVVGLDASILMAPKVWEASGHLANFSDPMVDCKHCKARFRADALKDPNCCPNCGTKGQMTEPRAFHLMFKTFMGPVEDAANVVYLRPETAQGIFVNFENVKESMRRKVPFGIAQIGKSFRNEITPGNFIFRTREFEQMEMQYFVKPGEDKKTYEMWKEIRHNFYLRLGFKADRIRFHEHGPGELAHYCKQAEDVEFDFPGIGWQELEGIHNRGDYDLSNHQKLSGKSLEYFDESTKEKFIPNVVETAVGCDRLFLALLCDAYNEETAPDAKGKPDTRIVLRLHPDIAPVKAAILPLSKKPQLQDFAHRLQADLVRNFAVQYDETGSIGKRYRRQDEIGTPYCVTVDFDSMDDNKVTVRHRDSMKQDRIGVSRLNEYLQVGLSQFDR